MNPEQYEGQNRMIQTYHGKTRTLGMKDNAKKAFLKKKWGVDSSTKLTEDQMYQVLTTLEDMMYGRDPEANGLRRSVMAAIGDFFEEIGVFHEGNKDDKKWRTDQIIKTACRAGMKKKFNDIPKYALYRIKHRFNNDRKITKNTDELIREIRTEILLTN